MRTVLRIAAALGCVGAVAATGSQASAQREMVSFAATAVADGVRIDVDVASAPLSKDVVDAGGPVAQARISGLGESRAFASLPYPGDVAIGAAPLVASLVGAPSPPPYPLIAQSDAATTPESAVEQPGVALVASSGPTRSAAAVDVGGATDAASVGRASAIAEATLDDSTGTVFGAAESTTESAAFDGVLRIASTRATARATRPAERDPTYESSFVAEGVTAAGLPIGVSDAGLLLPGSTAPVPDTAGLAPVLDGAGITLRYLAPATGEGSIVSAGLAVTLERDVPSFGRSVVTYTFGRAIATAASTSVAADMGAVRLPPTAPAAPPAAAVPARPPVAPVPAPMPAAPAAAEQPAAAPAVRTAPIGDITFPAASATTLYLVLVAGTAIAAAALVAARVFGVRLAWI